MGEKSLCFNLLILFQIGKILCQYYYNPPIQTLPLMTCNRDFSGKFFTIATDWNFSNDQIVNCVFTIKKFSPDVCSLKFNFKRFSLRNEPDCLNEYLMIGNEKLCGSFLGYREFQFQGNDIVLRYRGHRDTPINIDAEQSTCSSLKTQTPNCNLVSRQIHTEISSPNYPQPYPSTINCQYTILPSNRAICQAAIYFQEFTLEESFECEKDKFTIGSEAFCGKLTGYRTQRPLNNNLILRFVSDNSINDKGFRIIIEQIPCDDHFRINTTLAEPQIKNQPSFYPQIFPYPPARQAPPSECCNRPYNSPYLILTSPGFLDTNNNYEYNCLYTIIPSTPLTCRLRLHFKHFWVGEEDVYYGCVNGFVEIDNRRFCGCRDGFNYVTYFENGPKELLLNFRGFAQRGFIIEAYQEECQDGFNYATFPIRNSSVDPNTEIEVFFTNITSERAVSRFLIPSDSTRCSFWGLPDWVDQIRLFLLNAAVPSYCPANSGVAPPVFPPPVVPPQIFPPVLPPDTGIYPPPGNFLPPVYPVQPPPVVSSRCQVFTITQGIFQSPRYPSNYPPLQKTCYRFQRIQGYCRVQISVLDFDLEWSFKCWKDYLLMDRTTRFCGQALQAMAYIINFRRDGYAYVDFISDKTYSGRGFRANFLYLPCIPAYSQLKSEPIQEQPPNQKILPITPHPPTIREPPYPPATSPPFKSNDDFDLNVPAE